MTKRIGIREAVRLAENHAVGILESTDDLAYWGEDFFDAHDDDNEWKILQKAREIILNRIKRNR